VDDAAVGSFLLLERCVEDVVKSPGAQPIGAELAGCVHDEFDEIASCGAAAPQERIRQQSG
jgi:hypothetical protein